MGKKPNERTHGGIGYVREGIEGIGVRSAS